MARSLFCALLALAAMGSAVRVRAVEVSLEENKVAKGSVGYVDMRLLFKLFPETQKAKQSFEEAVRQAEEQINLRRAEILGIRGEISRLKAEREFAVRSSSAPIVSLAPQAQPTAAPRPAPVPTTNPNAAPNIPGMAEVTTSSAPIVAVSSAPAAAPAATAPTATSSPSGGSAIQARLAELDRGIGDKSKLLETKEAEFKAFESQAEKSLLDLEGRKTEVLLGRIYGAIQDVSRLEGISVVVDKTQILFGHKAVDITDKVVQKLKSENP